MAVGSLSLTLPTFAAAVGVYLFNNHHQNSAKHVENPSQTRTDGSSTMVRKDRLEKEEEKEKKKKVDRPRFAVELDGLNCFETLVAH